MTHGTALLQAIDAELQNRIDAFIASLANTDTPPEPPQQWLIDQVIEQHSLAWITGHPGAGKSWVAVDIAASIATGRTWDSNHTQQCPVLYVAAERYRDVRKRIRGWEKHNRMRTPSLWVMRCDSRTTPHLGKGRDIDALIATAQQIEARCIIIDTQSRTTSGLQENDSAEMSNLTRNLQHIADQTGAAVIVIHHTAKAGNAKDPRGHSALKGAADTVLHVQREAATRQIVVTDEKQATTADGTQRRFRLALIDDSGALEPAAKPQGMPPELAQGFDTSGDKLTTAQAAAHLCVSTNTAKKRLELMERQGLVTCSGNGKATRWIRLHYALPDIENDDE
jgi:RecA-family ATPase